MTAARQGLAIVLSIALAKLLLNVAFASHYGYFRDELYYMACADHLAWGYVDHPPLSIAILALTRHLFGDSLLAIRFPAALAGAIAVYLTGTMARRLGGGRFAQGLAALCIALSPVVLGNGGRYFSMNAFDLLLWALAFRLLISIVLADRERLWIALGVVIGLGVLNKYSMLFFSVGLVVAVVVTPLRRALLRPWIWIGGALAVVLIAPHAWWEWRHGFPTAEFIRNATQLKNVRLSPAEFLLGQVQETGFGQTLVWITGLASFALARRRPELRVFFWIYVVVLAIMLAADSKAYYLTPIYFPFVAAGAVAITSTRLSLRRWLQPVVATAVVALGAVALPFAVPLLPVDTFIRYQAALGQKPKAQERNAVAELPQYYADMFGWEEMVATVARVYHSLPPDERAHTVIYVRNYGEAAALDFFGPKYHLPRATSAHNNYWYWGTGVEPMTTAIVFGGGRNLEENLNDLRGAGRFDSAELAATTACTHCMPFENGRQIFLCRGPRFQFRDIWEHERHFI